MQLSYVRMKRKFKHVIKFPNETPNLWVAQFKYVRTYLLYGFHRNLDFFIVCQALFELEQDIEHALPDSPLAHVVRVVKTLDLLEGGHQVEPLVLVRLLFALQQIHVFVIGFLESVGHLVQIKRNNLATTQFASRISIHPCYIRSRARGSGQEGTALPIFRTIASTHELRAA